MNKKIIFIIILAIALIGSGFGVYYYLSSEDKNTSLTKIEKEWIENNKQDLIDLGVSSTIRQISKNTKQKKSENKTKTNSKNNLETLKEEIPAINQ